MEPNMSLLSTVPVKKEPVNDLSMVTPYYPSTICVLLHGARAPVISYKEIVQALEDYAEVDKADIEDLSHLGTNTVWFLRPTSEAKEKLYEKLDFLSFTIDDGSVKFYFIPIKDIYQLGSLHGTPAHFTYTDVTKIIRSVSILRHSVFFVRPLGGGSWQVLFIPRKQHFVSNYVDIHYSVNEHQRVVLTLNGRVNSSHFCSVIDCRVLRFMLSLIPRYIILKLFRCCTKKKY